MPKKAITTRPRRIYRIIPMTIAALSTGRRGVLRHKKRELIQFDYALSLKINYLLLLKMEWC